MQDFFGYFIKTFSDKDLLLIVGVFFGCIQLLLDSKYNNNRFKIRNIEREFHEFKKDFNRDKCETYRKEMQADMNNKLDRKSDKIT